MLRYAVLLPLAMLSDANVYSFEKLGKCTSNIGGITINWQVAHSDFIWEIIEKQAYTPRPEFKIYDNYTVIDAGANIGTFTRYAGLMAPKGKVVAIEPNTHLFGILRRNVALNRLSNVQLVNAALTDSTSAVTFYQAKSGGSLNRNVYRIRLVEERRSVSPETVFSTFGIDSIDLFKIRIEGSEFQLFRNPSFLQRTKRIVIGTDPRLGDIALVLNLLIKAGFRVRTSPAYLAKGQLYIYATRDC